MSIELMTAVWKTDIGPATKRLVLLALADSANDEGSCFLLISTIARKTGAGESSVQRVLAELEKDGFVRKEHRQGRSTIFHLSLAKIRGSQIETPPRSETPAPSNRDPRGSQIETHNRPLEPKEEPKDSDAAASAALFEVPEQDGKDAPEPKAPTINQRANALATQHYERLGKMGNVPAFAKIAKQALLHDWPDDAVDKAMAYIAENRWTLTAERLANTLRGGPKPPSRPAPARPSTAAKPVGNQLLEF